MVRTSALDSVLVFSGAINFFIGSSTHPMIKYLNNEFPENCIIEFCILPDFPIYRLLDSIVTDLGMVYIDTRGTLSTTKNCYRLFSHQEYSELFIQLKVMRDKLIIIDSVTAIVDSCDDGNDIIGVYNSLWELIYFNNFSVIVTNHYKVLNRMYHPRLGNLWMLNVTYRVMLKHSEEEENYEVVKVDDYF